MLRRICLIFFVFISLAQARPPEEAEFRAAGGLAEEIADWIVDLPNKPESMAIFSVYSNPPLEKDFSQIVETEILKSLVDNKFDKVRTCSECKIPQVVVKDDAIIVSKGAPDLETLRRVGGKFTEESFLTVDIYRTKFYVLAQAALYQNPTGNVIAAKRFKIPAISLSDSAVQVLFVLAAGKRQTSAGIGSDLSLAFQLGLFEELGFGKGGMNLGMITGGTGGSLIHITPTFAFRGRWGRSGVGWMWELGAGLGFSGGKGIVARSAYDLFLGTTALVGLEGVYYIPQGTTGATAQSYFGARLGFSLGR